MSEPNASSIAPLTGEVEAVIGQWAGFGLDWLRSLLGRREWRVPCVEVTVRL